MKTERVNRLNTWFNPMKHNFKPLQILIRMVVAMMSLGTTQVPYQPLSLQSCCHSECEQLLHCHRSCLRCCHVSSMATNGANVGNVQFLLEQVESLGIGSLLGVAFEPLRV